MRHHIRQAFSLIELLAVIAIISVLIGLLLPAVQRVREAANRISCANNLKQLGLAMHHYENVHGHLPPNKLGEHLATWAVLILPYMEQDNLYAQWNVKKYYFQQNDMARQSAVPNYFCPSRRTMATAPRLSVSGDKPPAYVGLAHVPGALSDYAVCIDGSGHDSPGET